jgi:hypothetical protein
MSVTFVPQASTLKVIISKHHHVIFYIKKKYQPLIGLKRISLVVSLSSKNLRHHIFFLGEKKIQ